MSVTRDFDAMLADKANVRPTFKVGGQEFTLRARLPYEKFSQLVNALRADNEDEKAATAEFYNTVLVRADRERFLELLASEDEDDDAVIDLRQLSALTDWAMEHFTGKAPSDSSSSSPGANGTGVPQNVVSLDPRTS